MRRVQNIYRVAMVLLVASTAAACGSAASQFAPTAPSSTVLGGASVGGFATTATTAATGLATVAGRGESKAGAGAQNRRRDTPRVEVAGRVTARDAAARTLHVRGTMVEVPETAIVRHGGRTLTFDDIGVGDMVQVKGVLEPTRVVASEIKVEDRADLAEGEDDDSDEDEDDNEDEDEEDDEDDEGEGEDMSDPAPLAEAGR